MKIFLLFLLCTCDNRFCFRSEIKRQDVPREPQTHFLSTDTRASNFRPTCTERATRGFGSGSRGRLLKKVGKNSAGSVKGRVSRYCHRSSRIRPDQRVPTTPSNSEPLHLDVLSSVRYMRKGGAAKQLSLWLGGSMGSIATAECLVRLMPSRIY